MSEIEQDATQSGEAQGENQPQGAQQDSQPNPNEPNPLRSIHTTNFPAILKELNASLVVSTYQAGKVVLVKADLSDETPRLNTHFCFFKKPMGIAANYARMAVGCAAEVWHLHNMPAVAQKTEPIGSFDACYVPLRSHITGDIDIHEMAFLIDGLLTHHELFDHRRSIEAAIEGGMRCSQAICGVPRDIEDGIG